MEWLCKDQRATKAASVEGSPANACGLFLRLLGEYLRRIIFFAVDGYAVLAEQLSSDAHTRDAGMAEGAVVDLAAAAGGAALLENGSGDVVLLRKG